MRLRLWLLILFVLLFILAPTLARWYTDWLWFGELGYRRVFWVPLLSRIGVTAVVGGGLFLLLVLNLRPLLPAREADIIDLEPRGPRRFRRPIRSRGGTLLWSLAGLLAFAAGLAASRRWAMFQQFVHSRRFGVADPLHGADVGFYVFRLPVYQYLEGALFGWLVAIFLVVAAGYYLRYASRMVRGVWALPGGARAHLSLLAGLTLLVRGWGFWLDAYGLVYSPRGAIFGATYTDVHAVLPALRLLAALFVIAALLLFANVRARTIRFAVLTVLGIAVAWVAGLGVYPRLVQQFRVAPNELTVETPYLRHGIAATLRAFGLDRIREVSFSADAVTAEIVERNRATIDNVRLWDYRPLLSAYRQLQTLRPYYVFGDVDIDRYRVDGGQRQVMLAARELDSGRLTAQARTWVNQHLVYTHGYGLVMSPVNRITEEGMPEFFIKDIPPVAVRGLTVTRPQIYFGEHTGRYVIVNTAVQELDYPSGDTNVYTAYSGRGGIRLTPLRRLAFAYRFGDLKLLLSRDIGAQSRILFARDLGSRLRRLAPFLTYDTDPYLVLVGGRLVWIVDAYTTSSRYPYATPHDGINYIRNSVKVVVDAYEGTVDFYIVDPGDPVVDSLAGIFPELFKPAAAMPEEIRAHLRYPVDMFEIQAQVYATFHMRDPRVFYNREDLWTIPTELFGNESVPVEPYYVTMRLGNEPRPEFILILPFAPANRDNLIAWMAARNDAPAYGELVVYRFPKDRLAFGPMQVESRINQDPVISQQLTLWNQEGSRVIRGNLLVIPLEDTLMYVEPLFLQAERSTLPELKRVIVASGPRIVMAESLEAALDQLLGRTPGPTRPAGSPPAGGTIGELIRQAREAYDRAQQRLRQGDFAGYGQEFERLGELLRRLEQVERP
ncbi:MAG: UPF0182 family protein [Armatimonadota bacterium]|nr:UPF0182 family protein [Armatimonadota bacterium]MDR7451149.1 UPF0182 family protein [Armatimonadota bacterium]MDR7467246.1 UPF0182 family protein [Armatimonadota bacterium]MDR7504526.1 UPF0182 family protein [Armatimonadota bacterium]MDR7547180.1 UPF0182 family protein [Armatimonadota bacterium]